MDPDELAHLLAYMRRKLAQAEVHGGVACESFTLEAMRALVLGLEEVSFTVSSLGGPVLRLTLREPEPGLTPLGAGWPEDMQNAAKAYAVAQRIAVVHYRDIANSTLANFVTAAAGAARDEIEAARLIGERMR